MSMYGTHVLGERFRTGVGGKSMTKQSMTKECDINYIMRKYQKTGAVSHINRHGAEYGFATSLDFAESMRVVTKAQGMFDALPSSIRSRFANDPAAFLEFVQDDSNEEEMIKLGLVEKPVDKDAVKVTQPVKDDQVVVQGDDQEPDAQVVT